MSEFDVRFMRGPGSNRRGLEALVRDLPVNLVGVEVGSYAGESTRIFVQSGKFKSLTCIDPWPQGDWKAAEAMFDRVVKEFSPIIKKNKNTSKKAAPEFLDGSLDFVYIDANHDYEHVKEDIKLWLPKFGTRGIIAGHDYAQEKKELHGVTRAVDEAFGAPHRFYEDHSWLIDLRPSLPEIITYCTEGYLDCLRLTLPKMLEHGRASKVVVYTSSASVKEKLAPGLPSGVTFRPAPERTCITPSDHWRRKIDILSESHTKCVASYMVWLDADVMPVAPFAEVWGRLAGVHLGATRMFNVRARGDVNAGVIFFRRAPELTTFFAEWAQLSDHFEKTGEAGIWAEQHALSVLAHDAYAGKKSYTCTPLPEDLYNLEDDKDDVWLDRIKRHRPKLIHFKAGRWKNADLVRRALAAR